jgi:membrane associated rhomboid family serine protease
LEFSIAQTNNSSIPRTTMVHGPSGFEKAPITKFLVLFTFLFSFIASCTKKTQLFNFNYPLISNGQVWRIFTHHFVYLNMAELVLGSILCYTWKMFERQFGSKKFAVNKNIENIYVFNSLK